MINQVLKNLNEKLNIKKEYKPGIKYKISLKLLIRVFIN